ncbi:YwaF family protein [Mycoplasmopsis iners]|uniref:YwaF family protein n=1 Tax=Mycoplasmopsis iners TaxID=76630 RepID=UPI00049650C3|nr:YwaF family protein [Mycoplasmopsis iners]
MDNYGFFSPSGSGNGIEWLPTSKIIFYAISLTVILIAFLLWFFKRPIRRHFLQKDRIMWMSKRTFWTVFGSISLVMVGVRSAILAFNNFPNKWEIIPLHLCRLMLIFTSIILIINKLHWIKYFGPFAIVGAIVALLIPEMPKQDWQKTSGVGVDNFYFWDFVFAHVYVLIVPIIIYCSIKHKYTFKDTLITFGLFAGLATLMFIINLTTNLIPGVPKPWKSNYFYLGMTEYNSQKELLKTATHWPFNFISFLTCIIIYIFLFILLWCFQSKFYIDIINKKFVFEWRKSKAWKKYRISISEFFDSRRKKQKKL